jgi:hypothetical protein
MDSATLNQGAVFERMAKSGVTTDPALFAKVFCSIGM